MPRAIDFTSLSLVDALDLATRGKVKAWVELYPLEQVNEVRERLEAGEVRYRAVLKPASR